MNRQELIDSIDATYLKFEFGKQNFRDKIIVNKFKHFCVHPKDLHWLSMSFLSGHCPVTVFNFPFAGSSFSSVLKDMKYFRRHFKEADIVIPQKFESGRTHFSSTSLQNIREAFPDKILKGIIEPDLLISCDDFIKSRCESLIYNKFDYVKTHTGFGPRGVSVDDIKKIKDFVGDRIKIKASGGIKTLDQLMELKEAGATRFGIGIDSAINIINEFGE